MINDYITDKYYDWICAVAIKNPELRGVYSKVLSSLWSTEFTYTIRLDRNRAVDGVNLRYAFALAAGYSDYDIKNTIDSRSCSVLEMMVALACKCETQIMQDKNRGDRTSFWFLEMLSSLGLTPMTDDQFDPDYFAECMYRLLNRTYSQNGRGGLFTVENPRADMRDTEIWYQCMWYLEEYLQKHKY